MQLDGQPTPGPSPTPTSGWPLQHRERAGQRRSCHSAAGRPDAYTGARSFRYALHVKLYGGGNPGSQNHLVRRQGPERRPRLTLVCVQERALADGGRETHRTICMHPACGLPPGPRLAQVTQDQAPPGSRPPLEVTPLGRAQRWHSGCWGPEPRERLLPQDAAPGGWHWRAEAVGSTVPTPGPRAGALGGREGGAPAGRGAGRSRGRRRQRPEPGSGAGVAAAEQGCPEGAPGRRRATVPPGARRAGRDPPQAPAPAAPCPLGPVRPPGPRASPHRPGPSSARSRPRRDPGPGADGLGRSSNPWGRIPGEGV